MADSTLHSMSSMTVPEKTDEIYVLDDPAGTPADNRLQLGNLMKIITKMDEMPNPVDGAADFVAMYDTSVNVPYKVKINKLGNITLQFGELAGDPADSTTYYTGQSFGLARGTGGARRSIIVPVAGTVVAVYGNVLVSGTLGSAEQSTVSLRLNDTTDTTISTTVEADALNNTFSGTGLSVTVAAGDKLEIKWVTPAWATNPTTVVLSGTILIQTT